LYGLKKIGREESNTYKNLVRLLEVDLDIEIKFLAEMYYKDEIITKEEKEEFIKDITTNIEYEDSRGIFTSSEEDQENDNDDEWDDDTEDEEEDEDEEYYEKEDNDECNNQ